MADSTELVVIGKTDPDPVVNGGDADLTLDPVAEINELALTLVVKIEALGLTRASSHVRLAVDMVNQHFTK